MRRGAAAWLARRAWLVVVLLLAGCQQDRPLAIGFLGDLSASAADTGEDGRNGVVLALELANREGGVHGRPVELLVADGGNTVEGTQAGVRMLADRGVQAIVGPFTSSNVTAALALADAAQVLLLSPTAGAMSLVGRDDYLVRLSASTRDSAQAYARLLVQRGQRRVGVAFDLRNAVYSLSWLAEFRIAYAEAGGALVAASGFRADIEASLHGVVASLLEHAPDGLLFVASGADVARLAQHAVRLAPGLPMAASESSASRSLVPMGGKAVEGMLVAHHHERGDTGARYQAFRSAFMARFGHEPGYSAVAAYDTASVLLQALRRAAPGESPRDAVLRHGPYEGLQQSIVLDRFGDAARRISFTEIRDGRFVPVAGPEVGR